MPVATFGAAANWHGSRPGETTRPIANREMSALISRNRTDVGTVNEYADGRCVGSADAVRACSVPLFGYGETIDQWYD